MKRGITLLAAIAFSLSVAPLHSEDYVFVTTDSTDNSFYVDRDTIRQEGRFVRFWGKAEYQKPQYRQKTGQYATTHIGSYAVDCNRQSSAITAYVEQDSQGKVIDSRSSPPSAWSDTEDRPNTVAYGLSEYVCAFANIPYGQIDKENLAFLAASSWKWVHADSDDTFYFDPEYIVPGPDATLTFELVRHKKPVVVAGRTHTSAVYEVAFDCLRSKYWVTQVWLYNQGGKEVFKYQFQAEDKTPQPVSDRPAVERGMKLTCAIQSRSAKSEEPQTAAITNMGTAWLSDRGYIVTAFHVIDSKKSISIVLPNKNRVAAQIAALDKANDIAILKVELSELASVGLPLSRFAVPLGARVFTLGYPHTEILGTSLKMTAGNVSATSGIQDDPRIIQISVPVQSGNSGGPLLNMNGEVVGVISAKLSALEVLKQTGDLPQNVNYSVKIRYVEGLLVDLPLQAVPTLKIRPQSTLEEIVALVRNSVFIIFAE